MFSLWCLRFSFSPAYLELMKTHFLEDNALIIKHALKNSNVVPAPISHAEPEPSSHITPEL